MDTAKKLIIFMDSGDTIVNERSQKFDGTTVVSADMIEGMRELVIDLKRRGYTLVMVADGTYRSFENVYANTELGDAFTKRIYSEVVGREKPSQSMFEEAMKSIGLKDEDKKRVVMIGNNVQRDIMGANLFGIKSILFTWSTKYDMVSRNALETPTIRVATPKEMDEAIEKLNAEIS